ncbi:TCR/Tet family MFS transporter [Nioella sediminis]|uniref:TCR/Tet family MFS transporter n=1 Tax=Nioella sediminis TaxID=1912092 RepID=UPI0008FD3215|nr:TCR/Tet family MFS transporter [Nioella sediminis]TBX20740.1 MFS transporter [Roseovarius sp. JS7-11]
MTDRLPLYFILITVALDAMGIGLIMPVMPDLIREVQGVDLSDAAVWGGILAAVFAVMQFVFSPILGSLSDRFGRRPVLLISMGALALDYVIMALAGTIGWLLVGRVLGGITSATHATANAYMADITKPDERAARFGLLSAAFGVGFVLGPMLGGLLAGLDTRAPFWVAAGLAAANFALGLAVLPESLPRWKRRAFQWARANPLGGLMQIGQLPGLGWMLLMLFFYTVSGYVYPAIWAYFTQAAFGWSTTVVGLSLTAYGVCMVAVQAGLVRPAMVRLGEVRVILWALVLEVVMLGAFSVVGTGWMVWVLIPFAALGSIATPAITGYMSRRAGDDQQGELQGVMASVNALSIVVAPLAMTQVFFWFTREGAVVYFPGAPFVLALLLMGVALGLFRVGLRSGQEV